MTLFCNALAAAASLCLIAAPALADITAKDGAGASQTIRGVTCGTGISTEHSRNGEDLKRGTRGDTQDRLTSKTPQD